MKKLSVLIFMIVLSSCNLNESKPTEVVQVTNDNTPVVVMATEDVVLANSFSNELFGLKFEYPLDWFGPDEYVVENTIRVAVGSDVVTPYGGVPLETMPEKKNSYQVIVQYTQGNENAFMDETLDLLIDMEDGEMIETGRSRTIRVRALTMGDFVGYEYIVTLSEMAQTEYFYARQVVLIDSDSNLLTILGGPNNVVVEEGDDWRKVFRAIEEENVGNFYQILASLEITK